MKQTLQVRLSQHLALTPQLQQSIRLLQLSTLELQQEIDQMLEQNPFLEPDEEAAPSAMTSTASARARSARAAATSRATNSRRTTATARSPPCRITCARNCSA